MHEETIKNSFGIAKGLCWGAVIFFVLFMVGTLVREHMESHRRYEAVFGPNPGVVHFETDYGASGMMAVRDKDNAEVEVRAEIAENWQLLQKNPDIKIEGKIPTDYKFTKFEVK